MNFDIGQVLACFMVLFAVIDIIGSIPLILEIKKSAGTISALKASLVSLVIMIVFLFVGEKLIIFIGASTASFAVAGSFVLLFLALEMILGIKIFKADEQIHKTASIVPLAFPIIAGAGSMTTILSLRAEYASLNITIAILMNIILVYVVLKLTGRIEKLLGDVGIAILQKFFGIILLAIAVKLFGTHAPAIFE
ncbi:MAG: multiple antibiotic resistance protein [Saprospiraceae bacterium]|jgi:multiple antibiotic resistance protein|tara:strand:- start:415 stop:996 length:582 start_codon:yes stop_codon:yes gene_type:complete